VSNKNLSHSNPEIVPARADLPTVPEAFRRSEYEGWLGERVKRFQLKTYQKTQGERIKVLRQINELQKECLAIARNENDWQHFAQHERIRQKRLDLEEMQVDDQLESMMCDRAERALNGQKNPPASRSKRNDLAEEFRDRLRRALELHRVGTEGRDEIERLKTEHPELADELEQTFLTILSDMRERL
jgi:hypothetical protein